MSAQIRERAIRRQTLTARAFVEIMDTLVDDFDVINLLTVLSARTAELIEASAVGILLADEAGHLKVVAASAEQIQLLELLQIQNDEGPCLDCFRTGTVVAPSRLDRTSPWPRFAAVSVRAGYPCVCAIPLRLRRSRVLGCVNVFTTAPVTLSTGDIALAQALADVASVAIVHDQAMRLATVRQGQLQHALTSRVLIEQAKGMVAEHAQVDMDQAFSKLRNHARRNNLGLTIVAQRIVESAIPIEFVAGPRRPRPHPHRPPSPPPPTNSASAT